MILVLVFVGVALAAVGVLYFIDIKFVRDRTIAVAALIAGLAMVVGAEAALTGASVSFFKAQQARTSICELEGEGAHPENRRSDSGKVIHRHIVGCMKLAGYEWTAQHQHCQEAPVATNALCYLPSGAFDRAVTSAQVVFE